MEIKILHEDWDGVFFRLDKPLPSDGFALLEAAAPYQWTPGTAWVGKKHASFCVPELPHEGGIADLDHGRVDLVWSPSGDSVILTVRFDTRSVNRHDLQVAMDAKAQAELGRPLSQIGGAARREFREAVEARMLRNAPLRPRVVEVLFTGRRAFALRLPRAEVEAFRRLCRRAFGTTPISDAIAWGETAESAAPDVGFIELTNLMMQRVVERASLDLEPDIRLMEVRMGSELVRLRARESDMGLELLTRAVQGHLGVDGVVLGIELNDHRFEATVTIDGITSLSLPTVNGGLPVELAEERWAMVTQVGERIRELGLHLRESVA